MLISSRKHWYRSTQNNDDQVSGYPVAQWSRCIKLMITHTEKLSESVEETLTGAAPRRRSSATWCHARTVQKWGVQTPWPALASLTRQDISLAFRELTEVLGGWGSKSEQCPSHRARLSQGRPVSLLHWDRAACTARPKPVAFSFGQKTHLLFYAAVF